MGTHFDAHSQFYVIPEVHEVWNKCGNIHAVGRWKYRYHPTQWLVGELAPRRIGYTLSSYWHQWQLCFTAGVGIFRVNPRLHPSDVGCNLELTWEIPTLEGVHFRVHVTYDTVPLLTYVTWTWTLYNPCCWDSLPLLTAAPFSTPVGRQDHAHPITQHLVKASDRGMWEQLTLVAHYWLADPLYRR